MANQFIDTARITVRAGSGGNGAVAFHREKYVAAGGPDGGDGGRGGNIVLRVDSHMSTLMDFRYKRKYVAENGQDGSGKRCSGKDGQPLVIRVPRGTVVRDAETREIICDMSGDEDFILAKGGNGGWGNKHFATPTRQVPRFAKAGLPGQERQVILEINEHMSTLMDFRYKRKYVAANGMDGQGKRCSGKDGEDLVIKVPRGTVVRDAETGEIICDMSQTDRFVLARGGNGEIGRAHV